MKKLFKKYINNTDGLSAIELGICTLIILLCICFFIDLTTNMYKFDALSTTATYVTRTVERQGGISNNPPSSYNGEFASTSELYADVKKIMNNAGVKDSEFTVTVNGTELKNNNTSTTKYYGEDITVKVTIKYNWGLVKNFIGLDSTYSKTSTRTTKSSLIKRTNGNNSSY